MSLPEAEALTWLKVALLNMLYPSPQQLSKGALGGNVITAALNYTGVSSNATMVSPQNLHTPVNKEGNRGGRGACTDCVSGMRTSQAAPEPFCQQDTLNQNRNIFTTPNTRNFKNRFSEFHSHV